MEKNIAMDEESIIHILQKPFDLGYHYLTVKDLNKRGTSGAACL